MILSKKHVNFGQGLDFRKFSERIRLEYGEKQRANQEHRRNHEDNQSNIDKENRNRDSNFLQAISDSRHLQLATYTVFDEQSESEGKKH